MVIFAIGIGLLIVGLIIYFIDKYDRQILDFFQKNFSKQSKDEEDEEVHETQSKSFDTNDNSSDIDSFSPTEKFERLKSGSFVEFSPDPSKVITKDFMVTATGLLLELRNSRGNFMETGDKSLFFILGDNEYLVIKFKDGDWVAFNEEIKLTGDSANEFTPYGLDFTQKGQIPGSCTFKWHNMSLAINSVGYMKYRHLGGKSHLTNQAMVKFMLAQRQSDDAIFYLENVKEGIDRVWIGQNLGYDLDDYLGRILPKE